MSHIVGLLSDTLDDQLVSGGVSLRDFYALRTAFDLIDLIPRLNAVIKVP
jgi:hypothetical protein